MTRLIAPTLGPDLEVALEEAGVEPDPACELAVTECMSKADLVSIRELRASSFDLAILAVTADESEIAAACDAGADDAITTADLAPPLLSKAVRYAITHRKYQRSELRFLESTQAFGETLAIAEELGTVVDLVLGSTRQRTGAELALLIVDWTWRNDSDQITAADGVDLDAEILAALPDNPALSPLLCEPGIRALDPVVEVAGFGAIASVLIVPVGRGGNWGRGGLVLASPRPGAFTERDLHVATALASWAGAAILHASNLRERNRAIEVREQVLAVASHDLRTPLSVFNMSIELLAEPGDFPERASVARRAQRQVDKMQRLIGDLLDYAALDTGKLRIERSETRAASIARRCMNAIAADAEKAGIDVTCEVDDELTLEADAGRIEQALGNLLTNAVKFTPRGGRVELAVEGRANHVLFSVTDTGPGIPDEVQRRLFDRYYTSGSDGPRGTGLGLSIARGIVEAHGGSLYVESTVGEGSTFRISLPRE
jgi:signal transduction histidine kinase